MVEYDYIMLCEECKKCKHVNTCLDTRYGKVKDKCNYFEEIIMRDATPEERESVDKYIKSISTPTGVYYNFDKNQMRLDLEKSKKLKGLKCDTVIIDEFELPFGKES